MRIKTRIEDGYHVESIDCIHQTASDIRNQCITLTDYATFIRSKMQKSAEDIETAYFEKIDIAINDFLKRMSAAQDEFTELVKSCEEFADKIASADSYNW